MDPTALTATATAPRRDPAPRPASRLRRNLRLCTLEGMCAMPLVYLNNLGNPVVVLLLATLFHLPEATLGVIFALPPLANAAQLAIVNALGRVWSQKRITLLGCWTNFAAWIVLLLALPGLAGRGPGAALPLVLLFAVLSLGNAVMGVSWMSWVQEWLPERLRGRYFGIRNRLLQLATLAFLLAVTWVLHRYGAAPSVLVFQILLGAAAAVRLVSIVNLGRIRMDDEDAHHRAQAPLREQWRLLTAGPDFLRYLAFGVWWGASTSLFGPFFNVLLLDVARVPPGEVMLLNVVGTLTGAVALPAWGRLLDRHGNRPLMAITLTLWMIPGAAWWFLEPGRHHFLYLLYASGGIWGAGFLLGQFGLLLKLVPPGAKTLAVSLHAAGVALAAFAAPIVGGQLLEAVQTAGVARDLAYRVASVGHHGLVLLGLVLLLRVREPRAAAISTAVGAMRSSRQIASLLGLTFFSSFFFHLRRPVRRRD